LLDDFDWKAGNKSFVKRAIEALEFFSASADQQLVGSIDAIRERVNAMKHDPLSNRVQQSDAENEFKTFTSFWEALSEIEGSSFA